MTVKEFLKDYISINPFEQKDLCMKLKNELAQGAKIHAGWAFFVHLMENTWYNQNLDLAIDCALYHPDNISKLCNAIFNTDDIMNVLTFLDAFEINGVKTDSLLDLLLSRVHINASDFPEIEYSSIKTLILQNCATENNLNLERMDNKYHVVPELHLDPLMKACPYDRKKYVTDSFDCEDFARNTKSWLADQGIGNATFFPVVINCYDWVDGVTKYSFSHGVILLILQTFEGNYKVKYWEPQRDTTWDADKPMPWGWGEKMVKLRSGKL